jgi:hypothetical protein
MKRSIYRFIVATALLCGTSIPGWSDSLQLKNGHHYFGRYAGGTEGVIAFQTEGSVQYFPVSDVVQLMFGESGEQAISPLSKKAPAGTPRPHVSRSPSKAGTPELIRARETRTVYY